MTDVWFDDVPVEDYGCVVTQLSGWLAAPNYRWSAAGAAGLIGAYPSSSGLTAEPKRLQVGLYFTSATMAARRTAIASLLIATRGRVRVRVNDTPTRWVEAVRDGGDGESVGLALVEPSVNYVLSLTAHNPIWYDVNPSSVVIPTGVVTDLSGALGGVAARGLFQLANITTSTVLTVANRAGSTLTTTTLTGTTGASEYLIVDGDNQMISRVTGATVVDAFSWKGSTDRFPLLDPADGPTVALSSSAVGQFFNRKAWEV